VASGRGRPRRSDIGVTFDVHEWFVGDGPDILNVEMLPPGIRTSVGTADYGVARPAQLVV
jgi:hypothetical protein